ncbi:MAG: acyl-ACP--UDP-N-acetylglucosamine O-acyltransferase [Armatimonadetes bacterium]|nr:acyl-ACP--UDP-N-acetylglucosamine O-acyltransferase [Armatimonadota bacterium]
MDDSVSLTTEAAIEVHPTAIVHRTAKFGRGVRVGPYVVIDHDVVIGDGTTVGPHAVIHPDVAIGRDNMLDVGVVIGCTPLHKGYKGERTFVRIGDGNLIREYVTIERGYGEGTTTIIGDRNFIMTGVHVGHNAVIGHDAVLTCSALLGGFVVIEDQANLSGSVGVHQFVRVGRLAMVGGVSMIRQDVPPFILISGNPARAHALNTVGLVRAGVGPAHRSALKRAFVLLYRSGLSVPTALARMDAELGDDPYVQSMIAFIRGSQKRGIVRWAKEK